MSVNELDGLSPDVRKGIKDLLYLMVLEQGIHKTRRSIPLVARPLFNPILDEIAKPLDDINKDMESGGTNYRIGD